ncbi:MAG: class I SAM-dependent methyltransferase [Sulfuricaulis sp.]
MSVDDSVRPVRADAISNREQTSVNCADNVIFNAYRNENIEALIKTVEAGDQAGEIILKLSRIFPFSQSKIMRSFLLGIDKHLISKRRKAYRLLIRALRETLVINDRLNEQAKQLVKFLDEQKKKTSAIEDEERSLDALYIALEDQFRGSREDIKERQKVFLPLIKRSLIETGGLALDIGCGRGEWLELLREQGLLGLGIDTNRFAIIRCRELGLDIVEGNAISYLRTIPSSSLGAVTSFHVVEHLPFNVLMQLFDEIVRTLKTGGVVILETPNPQNVLVGSNNFYYDPTHRNPIPSPTLKFLAEARGIGHVEILNLHPYPESNRVNGSDVAVRFNEYFYGPQDYAIIGYKL